MVKVKLPMHVFVFNFPLDDALILERCCQHLPVFEDLYALNHARVAKETASGCHLFLPNLIELMVDYLQLF